MRQGLGDRPCSLVQGSVKRKVSSFSGSFRKLVLEWPEYLAWIYLPKDEPVHLLKAQLIADPISNGLTALKQTGDTKPQDLSTTLSLRWKLTLSGCSRPHTPRDEMWWVKILSCLLIRSDARSLSGLSTQLWGWNPFFHFKTFNWKCHGLNLPIPEPGAMGEGSVDHILPWPVGLSDFPPPIVLCS